MRKLVISVLTLFFYSLTYAFPDISPVYQQATSENKKNFIESVVGKTGSPNIVLNNNDITNNGDINFSPVVNDVGDYAYAVTTYSNSQSQVVLNGKPLESVPGLNRFLSINATGLYWISSRASSRAKEGMAYYLYVYNFQSKKTSFVPVNATPGGRLLKNGYVILLQFNDQKDEYVVSIYNPYLILQEQYTYGGSSVFLASENNNFQLVQVSGSLNLSSLFYAYKELFNDQLSNSFVFGNDYQGRLSSDVVYRIDGMLDLYKLTGDKNLRSLIVSSVEQVMSMASSQYLYYSEKYSIDHKTPLALAYNNAAIYVSLLSAYSLLTTAEQSKLLERAASVFSFYDKNWYGAYRFQSHINYAFDGIVMPFNMQSELGLLAIQLYQITKNNLYLHRVADLYNNIVSEMHYIHGVAVWHYWPQAFYDGWAKGAYDSLHSPSRAASQDPYYEDFSHAATNLNFILKASALLGYAPPVSAEAIVENAQIAPYRFSRFISGDVSYSPPAFRFIPQGIFANTSLVSHLYGQYLGLSYVDFDDQKMFLSYVDAASSSVSDVGNLEVKRLEFDVSTMGFKVVKDDEFNQSDNVCDSDFLGVTRRWRALGEGGEPCAMAISAYWQSILDKDIS